jgi:2-polyprenyl-6-hydroxyphenyl methylase/3-demethylubiquinone-9 3-methyltransferase
VETIEHLYNPRQLVRRVHEALRPGGIFIVTTPYWGYLKNVVLAITGRLDGALTALWDGGHIKHFSRRTLTSLVMEQGFDVMAFEGCGEGVRAYTPYLWNGMLMAFRKRV